MTLDHSCGAIVYRGQPAAPELLMIRERGGTLWGFPKGHIEADEQPMQTARREILEETGVHVRFIPGFTRSTIFHSKRWPSKKVTFFLARATDTTIRVTDQVAAAQWVPATVAMERLRFHNSKLMLADALAYLRGERSQRTKRPNTALPMERAQTETKTDAEKKELLTLNAGRNPRASSSAARRARRRRGKRPSRAPPTAP
jgi:8-oxo-dGTP pyrophosphatase MutT (NUDIX family)